VVGTGNLNVGRHVVQFYGRDEELVERVTDYLLGALDSEGVAVVIVTPEHRREFETRLGRAGVDLAAAQDTAVPLHGLAAVDALARRWGVESLGNAGKTVWVDLRR
jgi:hypothetical protein